MKSAGVRAKITTRKCVNVVPVWTAGGAITEVRMASVNDRLLYDDNCPDNRVNPVYIVIMSKCQKKGGFEGGPQKFSWPLTKTALRWHQIGVWTKQIIKSLEDTSRWPKNVSKRISVQDKRVTEGIMTTWLSANFKQPPTWTPSIHLFPLNT